MRRAVRDLALPASGNYYFETKDDLVASGESSKRGLPAFLPSTTARLRGVGLR
jgi:hypothetical protein